MKYLYKFLVISNYLMKLRNIYFARLFNKSTEEKKLKTVMNELGLDYESAVENLAQVGYLDEFKRDSPTSISSNHWLLFAALKSNNGNIKEILEIGTYNGETTRLLSSLFPTANITTIDLKDDDIVFLNTYNRNTLEERENFIRIRSENLANCNNVRFIQDSSFFLREYISSETFFDLVWVDGCHLNPEVAWDICFAYSILTPESGVLLCDDITAIPKNFLDRYLIKKYHENYTSIDSRVVLQHIKDRRTSVELAFIPKRVSRYAVDPMRKKFIAYLKK